MNEELKRRIDDVASECDTASWDGYEAKAVTIEAVAAARAFADALDSRLTVPEIAAEPDGVLTFEWYRSTRWTLSVSVDADGLLHYAALFGAERICGTEVIQPGMPQVLNELIMRVEHEIPTF